MAEFAPKTAVITGGASGIGFALAKRLVDNGLVVMVADLDGPALERASQVEGIVTRICDVTDLAQVEALADAAFEALDSVDLVFNNAGQNGPRGKLWEVDVEAARKHFDVNYWGVWNGCRAFAPRLIEQSSQSAIFNTGSENSFFCAASEMAAYISAKHAVLGLTENLREDMPDHVHAGTIIPGWVFTPLGPEQFMKMGMDVEEYIDLIMPQIMARRRFVVSHGYNEVRIAQRMDELADSFAQYALPADKDEQYDVRLMIERMQAAAAAAAKDT